MLLNHSADTQVVVAEDDYYELLSDKEVHKGEEITLDKTDVKILELR